jgi:hypothetical protein
MLALLVAAALLLPSPARAGGLNLPPAASHGLELLNAGLTDDALAIFQQMVKDSPTDPLGYLLETEARWWQIFCEACEIKWNTVDAWSETRSSGDEAYLALADKAVALAEARIGSGDSAEMELYAGMGWMLRARLLGLRNIRRGTAQAGVKARAHLLRCLALDPQMADAYTGLGLYNYYVDTLSAMAKLLRIFMGIPSGSKQEGVRQLRIGMRDGVLTSAEARFYLAKNLRNYDQDYAASLEVMAPLVQANPHNPFFLLIFADTHAKLGHRELAAANFDAAREAPFANPACAEHIRSLAAQSLASPPQ